MKSLLLIVALLGGLLSGCRGPNLDEVSQRQVLVGTWSGLADNTTMNIYSDGRFVLNVPGSERPILGDMKRGGDTLAITYTTREPCANNVGLYRFDRDGDVLRFERISDECSERANTFGQPWDLANPLPASRDTTR